ncbi:DUF1275 domain-containing protein [Sandaracinobacter neustonicus]|uniref:DUF1275 domain-containing protein n=1 Tax=Sandaracinobacter neustonicus TaxID=1715348 RepID=A0A501XHY5_9SPHN|nr:YoaK family protein [Sandaracinobacter neustonicus]TPE60095.1 DUF1275 domain-containing protein [Sandaracinobacter neustonicus]
MQLLDRPSQALAASLAALAGFTDAMGFLGMGGFFVSFMSGNSTRVGVGLASEAAAAAVAGSLVAAFVAGVTAGSLAARAAGRWRKPGVLLLVTLALALGALLHQPGAAPGAFLFVAFAMGAENMVFQRNGEVAFGLTYMTGTLVKIGSRLADALTGGPRWQWLPWLLLWAGLVAGGTLGAFSWLRFQAGALWLAAAFAAVLTLASVAIVQHKSRRTA